MGERIKLFSVELFKLLNYEQDISHDRVDAADLLKQLQSTSDDQRTSHMGCFQSSHKRR